MGETMNDEGVTLEKEQQITKKPSFRAIDAVLGRVAMIIIVIMLFWSSDGLWHSNIPFISNALKTAFSEKFEQEQVKINNAAQNSPLIRMYLSDKESAEEQNELALRQLDSLESDFDDLSEHYNRSLLALKIFLVDITDKEQTEKFGLRDELFNEVVKKARNYRDLTD
ncbi:MAG: hypothetical protein HOG34_17845 [Bacteroidetes bacterium]|jgi:hypothetical protein|nr:hypothetical protein [Bacteroidota bacterium]